MYAWSFIQFTKVSAVYFSLEQQQIMKYKGMVETGKYIKLGGQKYKQFCGEDPHWNERASDVLTQVKSSKVKLGEAALMNSFPLGWISNYPWKVTAASNFLSPFCWAHSSHQSLCDACLVLDWEGSISPLDQCVLLLLSCLAMGG